MSDKEIEIKLSLTDETEYSKLLAFFKPKTPPQKMKSCFFDTEDNRLVAKSWALRVRIVGNKARVALKGQLSEDAPEGLAIRTELEEPIPFEMATGFISGRVEAGQLPERIAVPLREVVDDSLLKCFLQFIVHRTEVDLLVDEETGRKVLLEIDRTQYQDGKCDYELEVELDDSGQYDETIERLKELLEQLEIPFKPQPDSKFFRALKRAGLFIQ